jgi:Fic family protein
VTIPQKLKVIQELSGLSQEKLAQKFAVSFATLNSWINGKSIPRKKARQQIEEMYLDITGQKIIPAHELAAKKQGIEKKQIEHPGILKTILENPDIHDQFILSLTYHTNRIEGSTLTQPETEAILFRDVTIPDKSLIEHLEVKNHQTALEYLFNHMASGGSQIDQALILHLHRILMNSIRPDAGTYRQHRVRIVGADVPTANYVKVPFLMVELIEDINAGVRDTVLHIAEIHSRFEQIHPFSDGNGRIGRLLIHAMALREKLPPAVIRQERKRFYYSYLNKAQQTQNKDLSLLEDFICDALLEGFQILERK